MFWMCSTLLLVQLWKVKNLRPGDHELPDNIWASLSTELRSGTAFSFILIFFDPFFLRPWAAEKWWTHIVIERLLIHVSMSRESMVPMVVFRRAGWEHLGTREGKAHQSFQRSRQHWCLAVYVVNKVCDSCVQEQFSVKCQSTSE